MDYEIITLDGAKLLYAAAIQNSKTVPTIYYAFDTTLKQEKYPRSALFDQLKEQLNIENDSHDIFLKTWVYADFEAPFHGEGVSPSRFEALFNNGFNLIYEDGETIHFVPFLNSASQSKRFVYGFIREELFSAMRKRLDLDFTLEDPTQSYTLQHISKLYGYRALYSSGATPVIRATDKGGEDFFNEENIIILHEMGAPCTVPVSYYTAKQESADSDTNKNEVAFKTPEVEREKVTISFFDGEGIISPKACKKINERLPKNAKAQSFQVRMPYFKGMLHTVDFHQFLRDNGVDGKITEAKVIDAFGEERDLFKANIIVTTTVFKMWGLLSDNLKKDKEKLRAIIRDYFEKIRLYNHGFYVGNTEAKLHNTETVSLSAQTLSTLKLSKEDLDGIVNDHKAKADAYSVENLLNREERERLYEESDRNDWMELLLMRPAFLRDSIIRQKLENFRISRYNDIAVGNIRFKGENRFLSGDLYYFLVKLLYKVAGENKKLKDKADKCYRCCIDKGAVYIPHIKNAPKRIAMLRNPHLSRNEDVLTEVVSDETKKCYDAYLGNLKGVVFVGHNSCIPAALGGADFDGDLVIIAYDERIIKACGFGYVETKEEGEKSLPFVKIPTLKGEAKVAKHGNFVVSAAIYNSFSNNIGRISNCAMKLAAVEYDETLPKVEGLPEAAFCTILTGTEIDACKKGLRPDISKVLGYKGNEDKSHRAVVRAIETFIEAKKFLEKRKSSKKPEFYYDTNKNLKLKNEKLGVKIESNFEHNPVTQLLYRWADSFMNFTPTKAVNFPDELPKLTEIFPEHNPKAAETKAILLAFNEVAAKYSKWIDARDIRLKNRKTDDSKIFTRLIGQYDDIHEFGDNSLEKQMKRLMEEIYIVTEKYPKTEIQALKTTLYGNDKKIDANTFWPYGKEALENPLYREINQRTNFESFLKNFYFEGYRLLYLVLDNAPSVEDTGENLGKINTDCPYMERYYDSAVHCYKIRNLIKTKFEAELVEMALNDLKKVLSCSEKNELISKIYPPKGGEKARRAFWKIFTVGEVLSALGGDSDAK